MSQLLGPKFKGAVALNGNPTEANAALNGVMLANLAQGGSAGEHLQGRGLVRQAQVGRQLRLGAGHRRHDQGRHHPGRVQLGLPQPAQLRGRVELEGVHPVRRAVLGGYYAQAINKNAPHPAAARLWEEFLYSQATDGGQNLWLAGGARPVEQPAMTSNGSISSADAAKLPPVSGTPVFLSQSQSTDAANYLAANWAKAVG